MPEIDAERVWLEQELSELRVREAQYRQRLGKHEALGVRLQAYAESLHQLFRRRPPSHSELSRTLIDVARLSAQALNIGRTSVWRFDAQQEHLSCVIQLDGDANVTIDGMSIDCSACPAYVRALRDDSAVAVVDVYDDPRTAELGDYLREHRVGALLDIPVFVPGGLLGVVCHEHVGEPRQWEREEIAFASNVGHLIAIALETERRIHAEYSALDTEAKYKHLVEALPVTVYSFEFKTSKLDYVSPRIFDLGGWSSEYLLSEGVQMWIERIHPDDREPMRTRFAGGVAPGFPQEITYRVRCPDGRTRWVRDTCSVVRDPAGLPVAMQGVLADVTEQTEAELSRVEFERRYRTLLENVDMIAVALDNDGRMTFVNDAFTRLTGYEREALLGANLFQLLLPETLHQLAQERFTADVGRQRLVPRFEVGILTKSGETRQLLTTNTLLRASDGSVLGTSSLALDVTDRRRLESELLQQTKLESLGRLSASVAHDFNNLLTVVMAELSMLKRSHPGDASAQFLAIDQAIEQATELTRSLLLYGRKQPVREETFVVDEFVRDTLPLLEAMAGRALEVTTSLHADGARLTIDRSRMRQVLANLVGNASDATIGHGKGMRIGTHLVLLDERSARQRGAPKGGEFVVISVTDDGRGMDARTRSRIFDPFFTTKARGRGTGLGLAITQTVAAQSGGFIDVSSVEGKGTTFRVFMPVTPQPRPPVIAASPPPPAIKPADDSNLLCVLVVDDVAPIRDLIGERLRELGYIVVTAPDTRTATEILASETIDLLITDVALPDGSGTVLARSARSVQPTLRIILMSGSGGFEESFDGTLDKPFDEATLLRVVTAALATKKP